MRDGLTKCREGDRVGVGLKFYQTSNPSEHSWRVYLTVNDTKIPKGGVVVTHKTELYPSVTVQQPAKGDELCALAIKVLPGDPLGSTLGGGDMMAVDTADEEWLRLHDVRLNGPILEYVGRGKSGLATNSIFFCFLFVENSLICLEGKSMTPRRGNTILFRSSQQLPRLRLGPSKGFLS